MHPMQSKDLYQPAVGYAALATTQNASEAVGCSENILRITKGDSIMRRQPPSGFAVFLGLMLGFASGCFAGDDLTVTKKITANGANISAQTMVQGARERTTMDVGMGSPIVTIHQCDLRRALTLNGAQKTYMIQPDMEEGDSSRSAEAAGQESGGTVTYTMNVKDTGERKQLYGYTAKHLKTTVVATPSENACNKIPQKYEMDGWYVDMKDAASCQQFSPDTEKVAQGCRDRLILKQTGSVRQGLAVQETIKVATGDKNPMVISTEVTELKKGPLAKELFELPADYREVKTNAELYGVMPQMAQMGGAASPNLLNPAVMMNPVTGPAAQLAFEKQAMAQAHQLGLTTPGMAPMGAPTGGMPGMGMELPQGAAPVAAPQALGPKGAGKIRIGVAPPEAQVGQGNNAGADYSTPVRNAIVALMSGPAVEIAALDSRVPVQLQAEAQQKQCDFILYSSVSVKHSSGGFGRFMKLAPMVAPMAGMGGGMGGAVAAQTAGVAAEAAAMSAQQQAINQLAGFNGQIKSKDDVTVQYELDPTGQTSPRLQNTMKGKAKSDGEDVLTPLLQQEANTVLTEVTKR
jgi:hypothetical protein